jgi:hypothetical protein
MSIRCLRIPALLILALPLFAHAQSLGDLARQLRSERQQSGAPQPKVYTNDDLASHSTGAAASESPEKSADQSSEKSNDKSTKDAESGAKVESSADGAAKTAGSDKATGTKTRTSPDKEREARELEIEKRTQEINQHYLDRIAAIRSEIAAAQQQIAQLQLDQVESTNQFQRTSGTTPSIPEYQQQQRLFGEQIEAQRNLIVSLTSQLEDAQEAARHAGVPHATD